MIERKRGSSIFTALSQCLQYFLAHSRCSINASRIGERPLTRYSLHTPKNFMQHPLSLESSWGCIGFLAESEGPPCFNPESPQAHTRLRTLTSECTCQIHSKARAVSLLRPTGRLGYARLLWFSQAAIRQRAFSTEPHVDLFANPFRS